MLEIRTTAAPETLTPGAEVSGVGISDAGYRDLAEFRFLIRQFLAGSAHMAQAKGPTAQQHQLMLAIAGRPEGARPTVGYLAQRMLIKHHSAVGLVDRLAELGLVIREPGTTDRREVLVCLTDRGENILRDLSAIHRIELRSLEPRLVQALGAIVSRATEPGQDGAR